MTVLDNSVVYQATNYIDPAGSVVGSACLLADAIVPDLAHGATVDVDLTGLRSVSSSYFNTLLARVADRCGVGAIQDRLSLRFSSQAQRTIFDRSYQAVLSRFGGQ